MKIEVGEPLPNSKITNADSCQFDILDSGAVVFLRLTRPDSGEINDVKRGKAQFALAEVDGLLFFLIKLGSMSWMDMPFHPSLSSRIQVLQKPSENGGYALNIILVDSASNIVKVLRLVTLPAGISAELYNRIVSRPGEFNAAEYDAAIFSVYSRFSSEDLLKKAIVSG